MCGRRPLPSWLRRVSRRPRSLIEVSRWQQSAMPSCRVAWGKATSTSIVQTRGRGTSHSVLRTVVIRPQRLVKAGDIEQNFLHACAHGLGVQRLGAHQLGKRTMPLILPAKGGLAVHPTLATKDPSALPGSEHFLPAQARRLRRRRRSSALNDGRHRIPHS